MTPHEHQEKTKAERIEFLRCIHRTFNTPEGTVVRRYLEHVGAIDKPAFLPAASGATYCAIAGAIRDGRKAAILEVLATIKEAEREFPEPGTIPEGDPPGSGPSARK